MLIIFYTEKQNRQKSYTLDLYEHNNIFQHHYQNISWTDKNRHPVWVFAEFSNVCEHLLHQRQLRISDAYNQAIIG
jgi:hypothetical protein